MDFPLNPVPGVAVYEGGGESFAPMEHYAFMHRAGDEGSGVVTEMVAAAESAMGIQTGLLGGEEGCVQSGSCAAGDIEESTHSVVRPDPKAPGWFKRVTVGKAPPDRAPCPARLGRLNRL